MSISSPPSPAPSRGGGALADHPGLHSEALIGNLLADVDCREIRLRKVLGETVAEQTDAPDRWIWPKR